jgi:hypothetical protein
MITYQPTFGKFKGSSLLSPAHGSGRARATIKNVSAPPSAEKIRVVQQAGKKKRGLGEMNFCPPALPAKGGLWGGKRLVLASARKQSPQKLFP